VLGHVATCTTATTVWKELTSMFSSQSHACTIQLLMHLSTTRKGDQTAAAYYNKMKGYAYEMAATGKPLEDKDFVSYLLAGLDQDYNSFIKIVVGKTKIVLGSLYSQFLTVEVRLELQNSQSQSTVNAAVHGRGGGYRGRGGGRGDGGGRGGFGQGFGGRGGAGSSLGTKPICQLCKKTEHTVQRCWKRFDRNFTGEEKTVNNAEGQSYSVDTAWYSDTGAIDHITGELDKLVVCEKYNR
jgi:hypothetical protein